MKENCRPLFSVESVECFNYYARFSVIGTSRLALKSIVVYLQIARRVSFQPRKLRPEVLEDSFILANHPHSTYPQSKFLGLNVPGNARLRRTSPVNFLNKRESLGDPGVTEARKSLAQEDVTGHLSGPTTSASPNRTLYSCAPAADSCRKYPHFTHPRLQRRAQPVLHSCALNIDSSDVTPHSDTYDYDNRSASK